jgi:NitT/TauT family transport system substrate-binding protein
VGAHFTAPPYLQNELDSGKAHLILDGRTAFGGDFTFIIAVFSDRFIEENPEAAGAIRRTIERSSQWIEENPGEAASLLAEHYRMEAEELKMLFESEALRFGGGIRGMDTFRDFMFRQGYLSSDLSGENLVLR